MSATKTCEFCDKRGLPLLLVRNAIAPAKSGAPLAASVPIELDQAVAHYTKRLVRSGYINVYDEARRRWETYFVTPDGFHFKLLQTPGVTPVVPKKPFNCPDEAHRALASCITIPDPLNASKVWIGFSDVLWTDAVRKKNEDAAYRRRHMTEIDVKAVLSGNRKPHQPLAQLSAVVAEYAMSAAQAKVALIGSPFVFTSRQSDAQKLKQECQTLRPGCALIVTLADPAGIAQELAFLMKKNADVFINTRPVDKRKIAASLAIDQIRTAIQLQAEDAEITGSEDIAAQRIADDPIGHWFSKTTREQTERIRSVNSGQLRRASTEAWTKYDLKFDDKARNAWLQGFNKELRSFDAINIAPLAIAHVAWMKSEELSSYFECNFDQKNLDSGKIYTTALSHCLFSTQDKKACSDLYEEWLRGDISDARNLLLRAMVLNQSVAIETVKNAVTVSTDARQIPWDSLFAAHDAAVGRVNESAQDIAANLLVQIAGPVGRAFNKVLDGNQAFRAAVMTTGLISGHPVVICEIIGSKKMFQERLVRELFRANSTQISEHQMRRAVKAELKRLDIHGMPLEGEARKKWMVVADKSVIKNMPDGLTPQQQANWLAKSVRTVEALDNLNLERWRSVVNKNAPKVVTALIQLICLTKVWADEEKSLSHDKTDATRRIYAGIAALFSTTAEAIGGALQARGALGLRFGQGIAVGSGAFLQLAGRVGGICAGLFLAVLDGIKAQDARAEKQLGLAWLYGGSAAIGISLTLTLAFPALLGAAAMPIIGLLIVLAILVGLIIDRLKDNPVQDWLERCPWGMLVSSRYSDMETEQSQLIQALK